MIQPSEVKDLFILTPKSGNRKTGKIPVSMSNMNTCPPSCKMREGCYAMVGRLGLVWRKLGMGLLTNGSDWTSFCEKVTTLRSSIWRHNQSGDLPGSNDKLDRARCLELAEANRAGGINRGGYSYTHYSPIPIRGFVNAKTAKHNLEVIREMNARGFAINLSGDTIAHADKLADLGVGPVVTVLPSDTTKTVYTAKGRKVQICPAVLSKKINCVDCLVCGKIDRETIIGFPAHGTCIKHADKVARGE